MPTSTFHGPERLARISTLQFSLSTKNGAIENGAAEGGRGGVSMFMARLRLRQVLPPLGPCAA